MSEELHGLNQTGMIQPLRNAIVILLGTFDATWSEMATDTMSHFNYRSD